MVRHSLVLVIVLSIFGTAYSEPALPLVQPGALTELESRIRQLIGDLGDERFEVRDAASQGLAKIGHRARPALERATEHPDAEVASRAKAILERLPKLTHIVVDALGQPIPLAAVTIKSFAPVVTAAPGTEVAEAEKNEPVLSSGMSEVDGWIGIPEVAAGNVKIAVTVEHAEYGRGRIEVAPNQEQKTLQFPLVRRGTEARRRALTGQVVSPEGEPVAEAEIECNDIRTPGEGLIEGSYPRGVALTGSDGQFTYYLPPSETRRGQRGVLIPANSRFGLRITVPAGDDAFFPWAGRYSNLAPVRIELPRAARFHRFRFEAAGGGWVSDPRSLGQIRVQLDRLENGERVLIDLGNDVAAGRKLIPGKYVVESFQNGKRIEYLPVTVTGESPEELTFSLPHAVTYVGSVVHGVTGKPVSSALVMGWNSTSRNNLALLTDDDWKMLGAAPSNPPADHPALIRLREFYGVQALVHTDRDGRFAITCQPDQEFYGVLAFDKDAIPFKVRVGSLKPDDKHQIDTGEYPLFPAAKIVMEPSFLEGRLSVAPRWFPSDEGQPEWFERFRKLSRNSEREFEYVHWLTLNESQPVYVPANIRLRVEFETPYEDQWDDAVVESMQLKPGEIKDVGKVTFAANLPVSVRVVDRQGQPIEGVPVRQKYLRDNAWSVAHNTDEEGLARFYAPRNSEGQFWVSDLPGPEEARFAPNLSVKFKVEEATPEPVAITLTDEQTQILLGRQKAE
jgi:hypothetical protein